VFYKETKPKMRNYIAQVDINGIIFEDEYRAKKIKELADDKSVQAVIVKINSPGGTAYGGEELYHAIRFIAKVKPTVSVIGTVAASGGYMTAIASDYILSGETSITGSIGVIMQSFDITKLMENIGVTSNSFKSSPLKASPSPFEKVTDEVRQATDESINDTYNTFKNMVQQSRNLSNEEINKVADGRIFTGSQALKYKLVDGIGDVDDAIQYLLDSKKISKKYKVKSVDLEDKSKILNSVFPFNKIKSIVIQLFSKFTVFTSII
jgi:protease-4